VEVHGLLSGAIPVAGMRNFVQLDPHRAPAHIFRLRQRLRREQVSTTTCDDMKAPRTPAPQEAEQGATVPMTTRALVRDAVIYQLNIKAFFVPTTTASATSGASPRSSTT
jgi:hypothetical protein